MADYVQSYLHGYIAREGDKYQYVEKEKVVGSYDTIDALVKANPVRDGEQDKNGQRAVSDEDSDAVVSTGTKKSPAKKSSTKQAK